MILVLKDPKEVKTTKHKTHTSKLITLSIIFVTFTQKAMLTKAKPRKPVDKFQLHISKPDKKRQKQSLKGQPTIRKTTPKLFKGEPS